MNYFKHKIQNFWIHTLAIMNTLSAVLIFLMALLISWDVAGRFLLNSPVPGTTEMVKSALSAIVFLALAYTLHQDRHVRSTIFFKRFPRTVTHLVNILNNLIGAGIFAMMCGTSWHPAWSGLLIREYEGVQLHVPVYPIRFILFLASGMVALEFMIRLFQSIHLVTGRSSELGSMK
jgi:TRAP-type C4-dicarboxylate transport system permease small subunit